MKKSDKKEKGKKLKSNKNNHPLHLRVQQQNVRFDSGVTFTNRPQLGWLAGCL